MKYDLELEKAIREIKKQKARRICLQLPDGLKQHAGDITNRIEQETAAEILIWFGSCYGACDIPCIETLDIDLLIQWGHEKWNT